MRTLGLLAALLVSVVARGDVSDCACDATKPETLAARNCALCREAEKATEPFFFLKDTNPRKPDRLLVLPKVHTAGGHSLEDLTPAERTALWTAAIRKATELWGDKWALAYNGALVRTQCHAHIHIGKLIDGLETGEFIVVDGPAQIPAPHVTGVWVHPVGGKLHVHLGEQITESVLLR